MPFAIRLRVDPVETTLEDGHVAVIGLRPTFSLHGPAPTLGERDVPKAAKLEFIGRFLDRIREKAVGDEQPLGELTGHIVISRNEERAVFECDQDSLAALTEPPDEEEPEQTPLPHFEPEALDVSLASPDFRDADSPERKKPRLWLPKDAGRWSHLEVFTKLTIETGDEADFERNDIVDVPIRLTPRKGYPFSM
jgi:hypothetical protein